MKNSRIITYAGVAILGLLGIAMAATNPSQTDYQEYAVEQLAQYLKKNVCTQAPKLFGNFLQSNCSSIVDSSRPQIRQIVAETTQQQNFIFFSIYSTDLSISPIIPSYRFETVGALQNFYTYKAEKQ